MLSDAQGYFRGKKLVVFGAGYIGEAVARGALRREMEVIALTRNPEKASALREAGARVIVSDLATEAWHDQLLEGADFALDCVSSGGGGLTGYRRSYLEGMRTIVKWAQGVSANSARFSSPLSSYSKSGDAENAGPPALRVGVGTLVYTSSTSVYPQGGGVRVDESMPTDGGGEAAQVLLETEAVLRAAAAGGAPEGKRAACRRWFVLRLAGIYGPGRHHLLDQLKTGTQELSGQGEHRLNLIHRDDIVSAIWRVLEAPSNVANEIFNLADDRPVPKRELVDWLAERLNRPAPLFTGEPGSNRRARVPDRVISSDKIKALLGWQPQFRDYRAGYEAILGA